MKLAARLTVVALLAPLPLRAQAVPHATGLVHTAPVDLAYETFGARSTHLAVIAVNGGPGLSRRYMLANDMWQGVARTRLVVLYDQRGTGASKRLAPGAPQTMDAEVADLDALRADLHLDKVALVGDSFGGLIVLAYAAAHPEHVARLVLSDSPGASWKSMTHLLPQVFPDIEQEDAQEQQRLGPDTPAAAQASLRNHFRMIFYSPAKQAQYMKDVGDLGYEPAVAEALSKSTADLDLTPALATLHLPTLVLTGRYDMNVALVTAWNLAHAIPSAKLVIFEQSGHLPAYEEPERYRSVLENFLDTP